jgi:hypothetical protein
LPLCEGHFRNEAGALKLMPARLSAMWNDEDIQKPYSFGLAAQSDPCFNLAYEGYLLRQN